MATVLNECAIDEGYDEELLCTGWNPQLALASASLSVLRDGHVDLPAGLANMDVDTFLKTMYECQC